MTWHLISLEEALTYVSIRCIALYLDTGESCLSIALGNIFVYDECSLASLSSFFTFGESGV